MKTNLDLLVTQMEQLQLGAIAVSNAAKGLASEVGEVKAMAMAVREEIRLDGTENAEPIEVRQCGNRYSHKAHLWRDHDMSRAVYPTYRCDGSSFDVT
jgi:hypothetical protein